nr:MAG TPA: hypothetical protein [Caudoviricetes sp.]
MAKYSVDLLGNGTALIDIDSQRLRIAMIRKGTAQPRKGLAKYCVARARYAQHRFDRQRQS